MNESDRKKLFIHYMENVNYMENEVKPKRFTFSQFEKWLAIIILSCIGLMTLWEAAKEVALKLRF